MGGFFPLTFRSLGFPFIKTVVVGEGLENLLPVVCSFPKPDSLMYASMFRIAFSWPYFCVFNSVFVFPFSSAVHASFLQVTF